MKKFSFLFLIIILFLFVFAVSNLYLKKKNNISYQIFFHEPCFLSKNISNKISSYGYDNELFYKFWRKPGYHCKSSFRESNYVFVFKDEHLLNPSFVNYVKNSVTVRNPDPINGHVSMASTDELKSRHKGTFAAQKRAVTLQDYKTAVYSMT